MITVTLTPEDRDIVVDELRSTAAEITRDAPHQAALVLAEDHLPGSDYRTGSVRLARRLAHAAVLDRIATALATEGGPCPSCTGHSWQATCSSCGWSTSTSTYAAAGDEARQHGDACDDANTSIDPTGGAQ